MEARKLQVHSGGHLHVGGLIHVYGARQSVGEVEGVWGWVCGGGCGGAFNSPRGRMEEYDHTPTQMIGDPPLGAFRDGSGAVRHPAPPPPTPHPRAGVNNPRLVCNPASITMQSDPC